MVDWLAQALHVNNAARSIIREVNRIEKPHPFMQRCWLLEAFMRYALRDEERSFRRAAMRLAHGSKLLKIKILR